MSDFILQAVGVDREVEGPSGPLTILQDIDLGIAAGSATVISGPSGSGKSTLIGLLAGLDLPTRGQIFFRGNEITALDEDQRARLRAGQVGFVFQSFYLMESLTALENVMLPLELAAAADARLQARQWLCEVGLGQRLHHYPRQLSGGEQQRVAIARGFAVEPAVLFADEPTGNLDREAASQIKELLFSLQAEQNTSLVLVTHDLGLAEQCQRRLRLENGRIVEQH
ncbi:MAG: ATP-binding cassette domain-containing protein [Arenicellales bacterium]|jgi:putative ABC transport system ATP-binding protein|nr:ABC transporter [Acidiferrobacteraceae bacterium]MDP6314417.1 ATP-binding cassette domain-containing protein [Arenicellales bacterium]HCV19971.1 ABC transporter [Gammaproteobacteria bacterium]MDP7569545.1 ATP-binding cassette domain-containing protein [Arenicellales bacterium]MEE1558553.1 ATP-binding cassette domain-containing protein [Arenicellales bacterium]|tara:strand:- start:3307 stop:3984 length:678 start_codon:yes stop_codon:yes gene_type:complete